MKIPNPVKILKFKTHEKDMYRISNSQSNKILNVKDTSDIEVRKS